MDSQKSKKFKISLIQTTQTKENKVQLNLFLFDCESGVRNPESDNLQPSLSGTYRPISWW